MTDHGHLDSAMTTLQHIGNLHSRATKLEERRIEAEEQLLHRLGNVYRAGILSDLDLFEVYDRYRRLKIPGRMRRWNEAMPISWLKMPKLVGWQPNGPADTWIGPWPIAAGSPVPPPGSFIVYILFDATNQPVYVGSTGNFRARLKTHAKQKQFASWQAYATADRESAYELEDKLLRERLPPLNKKASR